MGWGLLVVILTTAAGVATRVDSGHGGWARTRVEREPHGGENSRLVLFSGACGKWDTYCGTERDVTFPEVEVRV